MIFLNWMTNRPVPHCTMNSQYLMISLYRNNHIQQREHLLSSSQTAVPVTYENIESHAEKGKNKRPSKVPGRCCMLSGVN
jgi:hypothetical protein